MKYLQISERARPGDSYLVDVGKLVHVTATSPRDALELACLPVFGPGEDLSRDPSGEPVLYRLDEQGEVLEVVA